MTYHVEPLKHEGHEKHLCKLIVGDMESIDKIRPLVNDGKFLCTACGRVANKSENLCAPEEL
ncbi:MAG: hypothetical protein NWF08_09560 [Candidatus Bathyarchaeota archaeon]|nr:hypothetical protein [Candidatus Bathyarchaeota archaeon]